MNLVIITMNILRMIKMILGMILKFYTNHLCLDLKQEDTLNI